MDKRSKIITWVLIFLMILCYIIPSTIIHKSTQTPAKATSDDIDDEEYNEEPEVVSEAAVKSVVVPTEVPTPTPLDKSKYSKKEVEDGDFVEEAVDGVDYSYNTEDDDIQVMTYADDGDNVDINSDAPVPEDQQFQWED